MILAAILFGLAAAGGVALLSLRMRGGNPPIEAAALHGVLVLAALVALVAGIVSAGAPGVPLVALGLFVVAAAIGGFLVREHVKGRPIPLRIVFVHMFVAGVAYTLLLAHVLS